MKRDLLVILAFVGGGVAGAAVGCLIGFFGLYGICRTISWLAGNQQYMHLMWVGMLIVPLLGLMGFVGGGSFAALCAGGRTEMVKPPGFDVTPAGTDDAG